MKKIIRSGYVESIYRLPALPGMPLQELPWNCFYPALQQGHPIKIAPLLAPSPASQHIAKQISENVPVHPGQFPLILLQPSLGQSLFTNLHLIDQLVKAGYIVFQLGHPKTTTYLLNKTLKQPDAALISKIQQELTPIAPTKSHYQELLDKTPITRYWTKQWTKETLSALDLLKQPQQLNSTILRQHINFSKVITLGMGFAGSVALELAQRSHFITAAIDLNGAYVSTKGIQLLTKPLLLIQDSKQRLNWLAQSTPQTKLITSALPLITDSNAADEQLSPLATKIDRAIIQFLNKNT
ncbi:hypothetical protein [Loigolactobacillus backii]|uniref:Uncharacterized protein n=1 Tax=Loigolactobacillus backii TaxID=375175 RepID=A0A192GZ23_9LACO|nr:hypothetical protein [Loigolactobacillus backii]ANK60652.1 hypothetical protein AYR52_10555 [Loigolactobacillus backii]ANK61779.1 hypothetical protein AYR53_02750 [Loigolactobacillus backii]ANK65605.1 hypothetical protein AYR54_10360 [Loigolactobacillus backii]ANK68080.1 hypothetical protein AYR55_10495 [Loigolactobacillus backii]ANK69027.1 hypothetical protein AYR56_01970 [Loigolactobacillus backii]